MKLFFILILILMAHAFAAVAPYKITNDKLKLGNGTTSDKTLEFDLGLGALNPNMQIDNATGFYLSKPLEVGGDLQVAQITSTSNYLLIGDGTASDKKITIDKGAGSANPYIAWDEAQSSLTFSNDGTLVKKIGSGSGGGEGGVNLLTNPSFEDGAAFGWTASGGTFTVPSYAVGTEANLKYAQFVASGSGQTLCSSLASTPSSFGAGGMIDFIYNGTGASFKVYVKDQSDNKIVADQTLQTVTSWTKLIPIPFSFATSQKVCFESTGAATLQIDTVYLGSNKNVTSISQAKVLGSILWVPTTANRWTVTASSFTSYSANASIANPTTTGQATSPATKIPAITFPIMPAGDYEIIVSGGSLTAVASYCRYRLTDGTNNTSENQNVGNVGGLVISGDMTKRFTYATTQTNITWQIQGSGNNGSATCDIGNAVGGSQNLEITVYYFPLLGQEVQTPEASSWFIDANIGGSDVSAPDSSSYTEMINASLDMVLNTTKGSAVAEIPCSTTNPSTGITCAVGSESLGVAFTPPYSGLFEVVFEFSSTANATSSNASYQIIETPNNAQTILQEGGSRIYHVAGSSGNIGFPYSISGIFKFSDTSKKTIRLMVEKPAGSTVAISGDRDATKGQRDIHVIVKPWLQNTPRAILTGDQVRSVGEVNPFSLSGKVTTVSGTTCASNNLKGESLFPSMTFTRTATGVCQISFGTTLPDIPTIVSGLSEINRSGGTVQFCYAQCTTTTCETRQFTTTSVTASDVGGCDFSISGLKP